MDCRFCELISNEAAVLVADRAGAVAFPPLDESRLSPGHMLVVPRRHVVNVLDCDTATMTATMDLVGEVARQLTALTDAHGVNVLNASGRAAQQSVFHLHFHVVPRWEADGLDLWPSGTSDRTWPVDLLDQLRSRLR